MTRRRQIVVLGMMAKMPVPGVIWQTLHYLLGLGRLGFDTYYVEAHARTPSMLMERDTDDASVRAASFISAMTRRFDLVDRWAYQALHDDGRCFGMSERELHRLYRDAELIINLHGGTKPRPELYERERLVYLETDPVKLQIELHDGLESSFDFLEPHGALFTFAENLGAPGCSLPVCDRFPFRPTRQPVLLDLWRDRPGLERDVITTVGNWQQGWRTVQFRGESYGWSKDTEWMKFIDLPSRTGQSFELALSGYQPRHVEYLQKHGWGVRHALDFGSDTEAYRDYITGSRAEFTVAKDQNVRFQTGWFSDRSATYLAASRPVVTQDTGFGAVLPTGEGLFAVSSAEEAAGAVKAINADYRRHRRAAGEIAREYFDAERVLGQLLEDVGITISGRGHIRRERNAESSVDARPVVGARKPLCRDSSVLALIPHFRCEEWLDDCLQSVVDQARPLDGIVVIDDASDKPPVGLVQRYPQVTLLRAARNVGPYRLIQQVMEDTDYDAYLFQDADDWSSPDRLELLLEGAERTGAELIGTQEIRVFCDEPEVIPIAWPLDVNAALSEKPTAFPLLHPTSLVTRDLVMAIGGFASGLRFSGDAEFLRRASHVARIVNIPRHCYYRRIRQSSLTTAPETGLQSPERKRIMELLWARARRNAELVADGEKPDLTPCALERPVALEHLTGPPLRLAGERGRSVEAHRAGARSGARGPSAVRSRPPATTPSPIFVVGGERSGVSALAWALAEHPNVPPVLDGDWLPELARRISAIGEGALVAGGAASGRQALTQERFSAAFGPAAAGLLAGDSCRWVACSPESTSSIPWLARLFPQATFIHVVRDVDAAVRSLVSPPLGSAGATGGTQVPGSFRARLDERKALECWLSAVRGCIDADRELGGGRMITVAYAELLRSPEGVVRRCLEFVGEEFRPECLRPLHRTGHISSAERVRTPAERGKEADPALLAEARRLAFALTGADGLEPSPARSPGPTEQKERTPAPSGTSERDRLRELARRGAREVIERLVPAGGTVVIVSKGDDELLRLDGRSGWHFPQTENGVWAGYHPADSADAISALERLQARGADFLFFPCTSLWWLDHYGELRDLLRREHSALFHEPDKGALFRLRRPDRTVGGEHARGAAKGTGSAPRARVVMVTDHFPKFSETFFVSKFVELRRRGWDVHVICNRSSREQWRYFPSLADELRDSSRIHVAPDFERKILELKPDLVHFGYGTLALGRMHIRGLVGCKVVVSFRGYDINYFGLDKAGCYDEVWQSADMLHFVGRDVWTRARRRGCPDDKPHAVITDAVDVSRFDPPPRRRERAGTRERPLRILSVGRLHWKKGYDHGLRALRSLLDRGIEAHYQVVGEGDHREATLFAIHDLELQDHVELLGARSSDDVRESMRWADALLHPAVSEGFCVSVIEAQAMGLPIVCTDADGLSENVADGVTGFVVPRRDAEALAGKLATLATDPGLRERLGQAARQRAQAHFSVERQLDRFEGLYRKLLGSHVARRPNEAMERSNGAGQVPAALERRQTLEALKTGLEAAETRAEGLRRKVWGREVVERVHEFAASSLPAGAKVIVVSRGDDDLVALPGRDGWHFPQVVGGTYAGHHPADSEEAIAHLEELRQRGGEYLIIPGTSLWWLEHYGDFRGHLERNYVRIAEAPDAYIVFRLKADEVDQTAAMGEGAPAFNGAR